MFVTALTTLKQSTCHGGSMDQARLVGNTNTSHVEPKQSVMEISWMLELRWKLELIGSWNEV